MTVVVYVDGLAEPSNPGTATYGYLVYEGERRLVEGSGLAGYNVTNNFAEYTALVEALKKVRELRIEGDVVVRSDSQLLIGQMSKGWEAKGGGYLGKLKEARELAKEFGSITFEWVPREKNREADLLSRIAYEKYKR